jgi:hypothetical protein
MVVLGAIAVAVFHPHDGGGGLQIRLIRAVSIARDRPSACRFF